MIAIAPVPSPIALAARDLRDELLALRGAPAAQVAESARAYASLAWQARLFGDELEAAVLRLVADRLSSRAIRLERRAPGA